MINIFETNLRSVIKLFVQANIPMEGDIERNFISDMDILELLDICEEEIHHQLHTTVAEFYNGKQCVITGYNRYKKDRRHLFFWENVGKTVADMNETDFTHIICLGGRSKNSVPLMVKQFNSIILTKTINIFKQFTPKEVEFTLCTEKSNPFNWMRSEFINVVPNWHCDNIRVARKLLMKMSV